jgi:glycosyltransferase involved in cell wall biosynthesis
MHCLDVYVSLHRSEGFGLTLAEAMAMGKPVIATKYSGNLEFMNSTNSLLVDAEIVETDRSYGPYPRGTRWADPNINLAANFMKLLGDLYARQKYGIAAKKSIQEKLSPIVVGGIVKTLLKKLSVDRLK